jgi:hypothetical protein
MHVAVIGTPICTSIHEYLYAQKDMSIIFVGTDEPVKTLKEHDIYIEELTRTDFSPYLLPDRDYDFFDSYLPEQFKYIPPNFDFALPYPKPIGNPKRQVNFKAFHHFDIDYG